MRRLIKIAAILCFGSCAILPRCSGFSAQAPPVVNGDQVIDGVAVRIEDDIITESEVRELMAFQTLVDGQAKSRSEVIDELIDQWIARGEAQANRFTPPSVQDVDRAFDQLASQFPSPQAFARRYGQQGLSTAAVRRLLEQQLYLSRFLDLRFRPEAEVSSTDVDKYYNNEFVPQVKAKGEQAPPLDAVEETIREVLVQRQITERSTQWLEETRRRLKIQIAPVRGAP